MSIERTDITATATTEQDAEVNKIVEESLAQKRARLVAVLDRSPVNARFQVNLPSHLHGEWVRKDPLEIDRMRALGFSVDTEYAIKRSLHDDGTGKSEIGDVVFMTIPKDEYDLIQEIKKEQYMRINGKNTKEERDYVARNAKETGGIVPTINESRTTTVGADALKATLGITD